MKKKMKYLNSNMLHTIISNRINSDSGASTRLLSISVLAICGVRAINAEKKLIFNGDKLWGHQKRNK